MVKTVVIILATIFLVTFSNCDPTDVTMVDIDLSNPTDVQIVSQQAQFAADEYTKDFLSNLQSKCSHVKFVVSKIIAAQKMTIQGVIYFMDAEIKDSNCQSNCATKSCSFTTWVVTHQQTVMDYFCV